MWLEIVKIGLLTIGAAATVWTARLALRTFRTNLKVRRAEWLMKLYDKFYEDPERTRMRRLLESSEEREQLLGALQSKVANKDVDAFSDYLNFSSSWVSSCSWNRSRRKKLE